MRFRYSLLLAAVALGGACYNDDDPAAPRPSFSVVPTPAAITVRVDALAPTPLDGVVTDASGRVIADAPVSFVSEDPTIASVFYDGATDAFYVIGRQAGTTRIRATYGATSAPAFITVTVTPRPVVAVDLLPASATLVTGGTQQFTATLLAGPADTVKALRVGSVTAFSRTATFSIAAGDGAVASVSSGGRVTALSPGTARVIATYKNTTKAATFTAADTATVADTSIVTVTQAAGTRLNVSPRSATIGVNSNISIRYTFTAANGSTTTGTTPTVVSSNAAVATVGAIDPVAQTVVITGKARGDATITFTSGTLTNTVLIAVQ